MKKTHTLETKITDDIRVLSVKVPGSPDHSWTRVIDSNLYRLRSAFNQGGYFHARRVNTNGGGFAAMEKTHRECVAFARKYAEKVAKNG